MSIIDYLQKYDWKKKVERYNKIYIKKAAPKEISSIDVKSYSKRFMKFMQENVLDNGQDFVVNNTSKPKISKSKNKLKKSAVKYNVKMNG